MQSAELENATVRIFISVGVGAIDDPFYKQFNPTPRREIIQNRRGDAQATPAQIARPVLLDFRLYLTDDQWSPLRPWNNVIFTPWCWVKLFVKRVVDGADPYQYENSHRGVLQLCTLHSALCTYLRPTAIK